MTIWQVVLLSIVQGLTELLPVSSSAHVVVAEKLLGLNPSSPEMTLLLVMLHTGTMFAVIVYFWREWRQLFFPDLKSFKRFAALVTLATAVTGLIGGVLIKVAELALFHHHQKAEVEELFSHLEFIAPALFAAGVLILIAGLKNRHGQTPGRDLGAKQAFLVGAVQGFALPARGFSRSGATISAGMLAGVEKRRVEAFSFALAVVLTPPIVLREAYRLVGEQAAATGSSFTWAISNAVLGMICAFAAGLLALKWLSQWLESGRWYVFGMYCIGAAGVVTALWRAGF